MTTFSVLPGTLNVDVRQGDAISFVVDFDIGLTGYSVEGEIYSSVTSQTVQALTISVVSAVNGQVQVSLSSSQTAALPAGTFKWFLRWDTGSGSYRTAVEGVFEVRP
jgi:hypothetical protein